MQLSKLEDMKQMYSVHFKVLAQAKTIYKIYNCTKYYKEYKTYKEVGF